MEGLFMGWCSDPQQFTGCVFFLDGRFGCKFFWGAGSDGEHEERGKLWRNLLDGPWFIDRIWMFKEITPVLHILCTCRWWSTNHITLYSFILDQGYLYITLNPRWICGFKRLPPLVFLRSLTGKADQFASRCKKMPPQLREWSGPTENLAATSNRCVGNIPTVKSRAANSKLPAVFLQACVSWVKERNRGLSAGSWVIVGICWDCLTLLQLLELCFFPWDILRFTDLCHDVPWCFLCF